MNLHHDAPPPPSRLQGALAWRALTNASARRLKRVVRPWMLLTTSMTVKLGEQTGQAVNVNLGRYEQGHLHPDERHALQAQGRKGMVREVSLYSGGTQLLVARTVFLSERLKRHPALRSLGQKSLGKLLFPKGQPAVWTQRDYALIGPVSPLFSLVRPSVGRRLCTYWARRSLFWFEGEPLLVTEIFLPALLALPLRRHGSPPALI